jgi:LacI family transcriptional regulator
MDDLESSDFVIHLLATYCQLLEVQHIMNDIPKVIALLEIARAFDRHFLHGISEYSRMHGPWSFHVETEGLGELQPPANLWEGKGVFARLQTSELQKAVLSAKIPSIVIEGTNEPLPRQSRNISAEVTVDARGIARKAINYFNELGFDQFAYFGGPNCHWANALEKSFELAVREIGREVQRPKSQNKAASWIQDRTDLAAWLEKLPKPIAILACDDEHGHQLLDACQLARVHVPYEVAVLGVGNDELLCQMAVPALSSISLNAVTAGYQAARLLDQLIQGSVRAPGPVYVEANDTVVRSSTDPAVSHDAQIGIALSLIRRNFPQKLSISEIAQTIGISRRTLELKFRKCIGRTILEEVREMRLAKAKTLLKDTELPVSRIAVLSGFRSSSHLTTVFGNEIGITPAKYRLKSRNIELQHSTGHLSCSLAE